eukprot:NODE_93_length_1512_cov_829.815448_g73_i0.p1 GENE.NODE_93_length_1512_cov_829.815448_g73_i0~~NODE_93_length_1512_cov_829.815448_g73_i0.p1  ORF type:complete len:452 (+),score=55.57 NODE_93_length_1512_cov_829.815448_g73_i0:33-1388(+)
MGAAETEEDAKNRRAAMRAERKRSRAQSPSAPRSPGRMSPASPAGAFHQVPAQSSVQMSLTAGMQGATPPGQPMVHTTDAIRRDEHTPVVTMPIHTSPPRPAQASGVSEAISSLVDLSALPAAVQQHREGELREIEEGVHSLLKDKSTSSEVMYQNLAELRQSTTHEIDKIRVKQLELEATQRALIAAQSALLGPAPAVPEYQVTSQPAMRPMSPYGSQHTAIAHSPRRTAVPNPSYRMSPTRKTMQQPQHDVSQYVPPPPPPVQTPTSTPHREALRQRALQMLAHAQGLRSASSSMEPTPIPSPLHSAAHLAYSAGAGPNTVANMEQQQRFEALQEAVDALPAHPRYRTRSRPSGYHGDTTEGESVPSRGNSRTPSPPLSATHRRTANRSPQRPRRHRDCYAKSPTASARARSASGRHSATVNLLAPSAFSKVLRIPSGPLPTERKARRR